MFGMNRPGFGDRQKIAKKFRAELDGFVQAIDWSPCGNLFAAVTVEGLLFVGSHREKTGKKVLAHPKGAGSLAWIGRNRLATAGHDGLVKVWNVENAPIEESVTDCGRGNWVSCLQRSPCGNYLAACFAKTTRIISLTGSPPLDLPPSPSTVTDLAWEPKNSRLAVAAYGGIHIFSPFDGVGPKLFEWKGSALALEWSPNGRFIASGYQDSAVHIWLTATGKDLQMSGYPTKIRELSWDSRSRWLATGGGNMPILWDFSGSGPENSKPLMLGFPETCEKVTQLCFQGKRPILASGDSEGKVCLYDPSKEKYPFANADFGSEISSLRWSPDDSMAAIGTATGSVFLI